MTERSVPEIEELIGAYALDAIDDDEREAVEQHLVVCPRCRAELAEHREVAALLAYDGSPAPADLWDRIVESIDEPPPALRLRVASPDDTATPDDTAAPDDRGARDEAVRLDDRRRDRRSPSWYVAAVAVAAAVALVLGLVVVAQRDDTPNQIALADLAEEARTTPGATTATLRPPDGASGPEAVVVVTPDGRGFLDTSALPGLSADRTYQLWGVVDDQAISLGVLGTDPDLTAFQVDDARRVAAYAVSDEVSGGVIASQNPPVVVGESA
jgi:anti-sigma-K factor RskA